jgi:hypothetical protein
MLARRRARRKAERIAQVLGQLDAIASERRPRRRRFATLSLR